jgi:hypothetical protein
MAVKKTDDRNAMHKLSHKSGGKCNGHLRAFSPYSKEEQESNFSTRAYA